MFEERPETTKPGGLVGQRRRRPPPCISAAAEVEAESGSAGSAGAANLSF